VRQSSHPAGRAKRDGQRKSPAPRGAEERARTAIPLLAREYGSPRHGNKRDPLDELIFILLSQMTTAPSYGRVFDRLKARFPDWGQLPRVPIASLRHVIRDAGLSGQRSVRLRAIIRRLQSDFGDATLAPLRRLSDADAETYLVSLPGVGRKTAKCVLMYALRRRVLPVDTHVGRVARRLGLVAEKLSSGGVHDALESIVSPSDRYSFHVNALAHGRVVCIARVPKCHQCVLATICPSASSTARSGRPMTTSSPAPAARITVPMRPGGRGRIRAHPGRYNGDHTLG
jgi:endonuclease III